MRTQEKRAVEVITTYLANAGRALSPRVLASVVGAVTGAAGCALTVAGEQHVWGAVPEAWAQHLPIVYDGETQGTLALNPALEVSPNVVATLAAPVAAIRLIAEIDRLRRVADSAKRQLIDDRWQATVEMEQERRSLERNLHDGAQHHIVALRMAVALLEHQCDGAREQLPSLLARLDTAERVLVDTAAGVLPIKLAADGLAAGLAAELAAHEDVTLDVTGLRRPHSPAIEAAVYFTCLEAVNNAHKHAPNAEITVTVRGHDRGLEFEITDTGPGFSRPTHAFGLHNLSARIAAVGGHLEVRPTTAGTKISGYVPEDGHGITS